MDSDDNPRYVLTVRLMFDSDHAAKFAADDIERSTGGVLASEYSIEEV